ncbi:NIPSNAP family protein [Acinetobacter baumannii]|uniref:NIPSNAP family protein n=1 Tax=Acinetobacter baumannii TaxID=470 RepID=UPI0038922C08
MIYQLRIYTLKSKEAAQTYLKIWEKHVESLSKFNIKTHAVYLDQATECQVIALVSYEDRSDPNEVTKQYMNSSEFHKDMKGFDFSNFINVEEKILIESSFKLSN